jgi:D-aminopeptidase
MLAGDRAACDEMVALQPDAETVAVKSLVGQASTLSLSHAEVCGRIRQAACDAVRRVDKFKPWKVETPVELKFEFKPDEQHPAGRTVVYNGATVLEAYQAWLGNK